MGLVIRTMQEADLDNANAVAVAAYRGASSRREELALYLALQPDGWLYAELDGEPAGLGGAVDFGPFATVGLVGVHPTLQRRGIARAICEQLLRWLDVRGSRLAVLDASDMGAPLYPRYGFEDAGLTLQFRRTSTAMPSVGTELSALALRVRDDQLQAMAAYDQPIFGADRRQVLESYAHRNPERLFWIGDLPERPTGYIVARSGQLGPWAADTPEDAEQLLRAALALPYESEPVVNVPSANVAAVVLLERYGFTQQRALRHMCRGDIPQPGRLDLLYGQASFAIG